MPMAISFGEADFVWYTKQETEGQPCLVNRLGQLLTEDLVPERTQSIIPAHLDLALARLANENNTHFASIRSKATMHCAEVLTARFNPALLRLLGRSDPRFDHVRHLSGFAG